MHLQQTYIDLVSPAYHLWQTGVFLYEPRIDAYHFSIKWFRSQAIISNAKGYNNPLPDPRNGMGEVLNIECRTSIERYAQTVMKLIDRFFIKKEICGKQNASK